MELLFTRADAIPAVIAAIDDSTNPPAGRANLVEVLWHIQIRENHASIPPALLRMLQGDCPQVREAVARALGDLEKKEYVHDLLERLEVESDEGVQLQILIGVEALDQWEMQRGETRDQFVIAGGEEMSQEELDRFTQRLRVIYATTTSDTARWQAGEFLEKIAARRVDEARQLELKADLTGAEEELQEALALKPDSKNAQMRLAKFYLFSGQRERGLAMLEEHRMLLRVPALDHAPILDGVLDDAAWEQAVCVDSFYQTIQRMRAVPVESRTELCVGHTDISVYLAVKGYEDDTSVLVAEHTERDADVWQDDSVEIFFDMNLDQQTFYQIAVNTLGTVFDIEYRKLTESPEPPDWNRDYGIAIRVEPRYWVLEMEIPLRALGVEGADPTDPMGFNLARVRIGQAGEHGTWAPTYGYSGRPDRFGVMLLD